jgi:serine/threonine-protein kinase
MDSPGARVTEKIVLSRQLGEGAMGTVWQAHHQGLGAEVAVKFLHAAKNNPRALHRFRAEASLAAQLRSPYVVQMLDYGVTEDQRPFIVMELLDGEPLDRLLARRGQLTLAEVRAVVDHTCKALAKAHAMGVVHRDIKPANLFNVGGADMFIKVLDFGVAKQLADVPAVTAVGDLTGTPLYMSPEQLASSRDVDPRTDIWALGVVAYQLLSGRFPFVARSLPDLYLSLHKGAFEPVTARRADLPAAIDAWLGRALAVARETRFQTADEAAAAFPRAEASPALARPAQVAPLPAPTPPPAMQATLVAPPEPEPMAIAPPAAEPSSPARGGLATTAAEAHAPRRAGAFLWAAAGVTVGVGVTAFIAFRSPAPPPAVEPRSAPADAAEPPQADAPAPDLVPPSATPAPVPAPEPAPSAASASGPRPTARPPSPASPKPNCEGDNAFIVGPNGRLIPKPGCI